MRTHISIDFSGDFGPVSAWLRQQARGDPRAAIVEGARGYFNILLLATPELAALQRQQFEAGRGAYAGSCELQVAPEHKLIRVNLECGPEETAATAAFVIALLAQFPGYSVYDEDSNEDVTAEVKRAPASLFR